MQLKMVDVNSMTETERLKLTVYNAVRKACDEVGKHNTLIGEFDVATDAKKVITELVWKKMELYAEDLEAFAQHAKRTQINVDDVKLLFRKNPKILEEFAKMEAEDNEKPLEKVKKRTRSAAGIDQ